MIKVIKRKIAANKTYGNPHRSLSSLHTDEKLLISITWHHQYPCDPAFPNYCNQPTNKTTLTTNNKKKYESHFKS